MIDSQRFSGKASSTIVAVGIAILAASTTEAQTSGQGHAVFAVGGYSNRFASGSIAGVAAGGELLFSGRFGGGGEVGWLGLGANVSLEWPSLV